MELRLKHFRPTMFYNFQECLTELVPIFFMEPSEKSTVSRWYGECKRWQVSLSDDSRTGHQVKRRISSRKIGTFKNAILSVPKKKWNNYFQNWYERIQKYKSLR